MTHGIAVDSTGIAIGWFTICGKHCILDLKRDDKLDNKTVDCPVCLARIKS